MDKNKRKIILASVCAFFTGVLALSASYAWFGRNNYIDSTNSEKGIGGKFLTSYFHCGSGTEEDPYVITRPRHWENLVYLHNNVPGFYNAMQEETEDEDGTGFYFQIGYDLDGSGEMKVYNYDDSGYQISTSGQQYSKTLNLSCYDEEKPMIPIGSPQYPFIGTLRGNDITVKGFTITSRDVYNDNHSLEDIGVFGYVGPNGKVYNTYFSDFVIDTNHASLNDSTSYPHHTMHNKAGSLFPYPCIGYLAGHTYYSTSFTDVYVNNCKLIGTGSNEAAKLDNYSYFGVVEETEGGSRIGKDNDYSFSLDSSAVYNYLRSRYDTIKDEDLNVRNTEYMNEINGSGTPFSYAFEPTEGILTGENYNLLGDNPGYTDKPQKIGGGVNGFDKENYSLSTIGYYGEEYESSVHNYDVYATKGNNVTVDQLNALEASSHEEAIQYLRNPSDNMQKTTTPLNQFFGEGEYYRYDTKDGVFKYYEANNAKDYYQYTFAFSSITFTFTTVNIFGGYNNVFNTEHSNAFLVVDNQAFPLGIQVKDNNGGKKTNSHSYTVSFTNSPTVSLLAGTHKLSVGIRLDSQESACRHADFYWGTITSDEIRQVNFVVSRGDTKYRNIRFGVASGSYDSGYQLTEERRSSQRGFDKGGTAFVDDGTAEPYYQKESVESRLIGYYKDTNGQYKYTYLPDSRLAATSEAYNFQLTTAETSNNYLKVEYEENWSSEVFAYFKSIYGDLYKRITNQDGTYSYEKMSSYSSEVEDYYYVGSVKDSSWFVVITEKFKIEYFVDYDVVDKKSYVTELGKKGKLYIRVNNEGAISYQEATGYVEGNVYYYHDSSDRTNYVAGQNGETPSTSDNEIIQSGYNYENIDVVGGGVKFSNSYITMRGEDSRALVHPVNDTAYYGSNSGIGTKFYATKYCPNSIILYLYNVGGTNPTDVMGTIDFYYTLTLDSGLFQFKEPAFKKGNGNFVRFSRVGGTTSGFLSVHVQMNLTRENLEKAAYCALDSNGNILTGYDTNGNPTNSVDVKSIDKYVLVIGVDNKLDGLNTRITRIDFSYVAPHGFGGDFGPIEYRSANDTVEETIFNFYFLCPDNDQFSVLVNYTNYSSSDSESEGGKYYGLYTVTFYYNCEDDPTKTLDVFMYLYDTSRYKVKVFDGTNYTRVCQTGQEEVSIKSTTNWLYE